MDTGFGAFAQNFQILGRLGPETLVAFIVDMGFAIGVAQGILQLDPLAADLRALQPLDKKVGRFLVLTVSTAIRVS